MKCDQTITDNPDLLSLFHELFDENIDFDAGNYFLQLLKRKKEINCEVELESEDKLIRLSNALKNYGILLSEIKLSNTQIAKLSSYWSSGQFGLEKISESNNNYLIIQLKDFTPITIVSETTHQFVVDKMLSCNANIFSSEEVLRSNLLTQRYKGIWGKIRKLIDKVSSS